MARFGIIEENGRIVERRKGHNDRDITPKAVKITFEGARATGKSTLMRAIQERLLPNGVILDPMAKARPDDEHTLIVELDAAALSRLREPQSPLLGLATTAQLIDELRARADTGGYAEYRTVDPR